MLISYWSSDVCSSDLQLFQHAAIAERDRAPVHAARDATAGVGRKVLRRPECKVALLSRIDDGGGERVLASPLQARCEGKQLAFAQGGSGRLNVRNLRPPLCMRAGIIDTQSFGFPAALPPLRLL